MFRVLCQEMWLGFTKCDPEQEEFIVVLQLRFDHRLNFQGTTDWIVSTVSKFPSSC